MRMKLPLLIAGGLLLGGCLGLLLVPGALNRILPQGGVRSIGEATVGGPFTLTDHKGRRVTEQEWRGKYMLIYFGYTFCPDVCPTSLNTLSDALDRLGPLANRIQPLFITVDPKRDDQEAVARYAAAVGTRITGLTGTQEQIDAAAKAYRVYYREHRTGTGPNDYSMDHSSILYLMGPDGSFIAPIRAEQPPEDIANTLRKLVKS